MDLYQFYKSNPKTHLPYWSVHTDVILIRCYCSTDSVLIYVAKELYWFRNFFSAVIVFVMFVLAGLYIYIPQEVAK